MSTGNGFEGSRSPKAFTLIELLIVIAIILILIAIALPNFLEAQMRARITKVEGEMKGLALALEAYRSDYPRYPPQCAYEPTRFLMFPVPANVYSLMALTSPVKYLTALPLDLFAPTNGQLINGTNGSVMQLHIGDVLHGMTYMYWSQESLRINNQLATANQMRANGINYALLSVGPDGDLDMINLNPADMSAMRINATKWSYNPTNGTKSNGDISRVKP